VLRCAIEQFLALWALGRRRPRRGAAAPPAPAATPEAEALRLRLYCSSATAVGAELSRAVAPSSGLMVAMARLAEALTVWEGHRAALEASTREIVAALAAVRGHVRATNADISRCGEEVEMHKRRRLCVPAGSGSSAAAATTSASTVVDEAHIHTVLQGAVASAEGELRVLAQALATVEVPVQRMRARVEPLMDAEPLAAAREARNDECSALVRLMGSAHLGEHEQSGAYILRSLSVVVLWRLRRVSRSFRRWGTEALAAMPWPIVAGGQIRPGVGGYQDSRAGFTARVAALDMASLRWSSGIAVPSLGEPRARHAMCGLPGGQIILVGGVNDDEMAADMECRWRPGSNSWEALPRMSTPREDAVAVALGDGRVLVAGGFDHDKIDLASAEVLAADGSGWSAVAPMHTARYGAVGGLLPGGQVIVAGGAKDDPDEAAEEEDEDYLATAELWDAETNVWTELPSMTKARKHAAGCVLPDGRFAVVGGCSAAGDSLYSDGEVYDCARNEWTPLPAPIGMVGGGRHCAALVPVAGGMLILGGDGPDQSIEAELWDEESQRWLKLPYRTGTWCRLASAVSVPAVALCKAPATS
jgi:hypothetical protein